MHTLKFSAIVVSVFVILAFIHAMGWWDFVMGAWVAFLFLHITGRINYQEGSNGKKL